MPYSPSPFKMSITNNGTSDPTKRDNPPPLTEIETAEILQSIRNSTTLPADLALSLDLHHQPHERQPTEGYPDSASYYWDASTMAPLNAVSLVSIS